MEKFREVTLGELSGGLNNRDPEYAIADNQSPDMLNMWYKDKALTKRPGQTLYTTLSDVYKVSKEYNAYRIVHAGKNLYKWASGTATKITTTTLADAVAETAGLFIEFGNYLYYIDGTKIWRIESNFTVTEAVPYVPVVQINTVPATGAGTDNDPYNLIGAGFTIWFNGDGTATYQLPTGLDATEIVVVVGGVTKTLTTHYTWVKETGVVTFTSGNYPTNGTDNVWITSYKTVSGNKPKIAKCKYGTAFGGESAGLAGGTRAFLMGNPDYPYHYWKSDLSSIGGVTYWPDANEELLDQNSEAITGCEKMVGNLIIFKEDSRFAVGYQFDGTDVFYPVVELGPIGTDAPGSIQLIDNKLVFFNSKSGVHIMTSITNESESAVKPLSANINALLLKESNLTTAVSVDFDQCYWLCVNGYAYIWDYGSTPYYNMSDYDKAQRRLAWYRFDGISPTCMFGDTELYYGKTTGIVKLVPAKSDFGAAFDAHWLSKAFDMGAPEELKTFGEIYPSFSNDGSILATVTVMNEFTDDYKSREYDIRNFAWDDFSWDAFTWERIKYALTYKFKVKMKKCSYIQIKVEGNTNNRGVGLSGLMFTFLPIRKTKKRS